MVTFLYISQRAFIVLRNSCNQTDLLTFDRVNTAVITSAAKAEYDWG